MSIVGKPSRVVAAGRARSLARAPAPSPGALAASLGRQGGAAQPLPDELVIAVMLTAVHSGAPLLKSLAVAGHHLPAAQGDQLRRFVGQVEAGASWEDALATTDGVVARAASALAPSWHQGASAKAALSRLAGQTRDDALARAVTAAAKLGVRLVFPLGLCFLPAFVLLGLVPLGLGLASP